MREARIDCAVCGRKPPSEGGRHSDSCPYSRKTMRALAEKRKLARWAGNGRLIEQPPLALAGVTQNRRGLRQWVRGLLSKRG